jgi:hypothetical protein
LKKKKKKRKKKKKKKKGNAQIDLLHMVSALEVREVLQLDLVNFPMPFCFMISNGWLFHAEA